MSISAAMLQVRAHHAKPIETRMSVFGKRIDFEESMRPELPVLFRVARRMVHNDDDAEDLVSQTLMRAHIAWSRFDGRHPRSWLIRILRNEFLKSIRNKHETLQLGELDVEPVDEAMSWTAIADNLSAEIILLELDKMAPDYAVTIQLCDVEQLSYEEAAEAMDVPIGTVRSRLFRARAMLRQRIAHRVLEEAKR